MTAPLPEAIIDRCPRCRIDTLHRPFTRTPQTPPMLRAPATWWRCVTCGAERATPTAKAIRLVRAWGPDL